MASVGVLRKVSKSRRQNEERRWNPVNPITKGQKAKAVVGKLATVLKQVIISVTARMIAYRLQCTSK